MHPNYQYAVELYELMLELHHLLTFSSGTQIAIDQEWYVARQIQ